MAKKIVTTTTVVDDLDGSELEESQAETVKFSLDGTNYEIDLSKQNAKGLRDALKPFTKVATIVTNRRPAGAPRGAGSTTSKQELDKMRTWARENGYEVSDRGRIAATVQDAYRAATK